MHQEYEVHSWECDVFECGQKLTGADSKYAKSLDWGREFIFGEEFDLCPNCVIELRQFLHGLDESTAKYVADHALKLATGEDSEDDDEPPHGGPADDGVFPMEADEFR